MGSYLTLLPKQQIKIKNASLELFRLSVKFKQYKEEYEKKKQELQSIILKRGFEEFAVDTPEIGRYIKVKPVESNKIIWDVNKLEKKIGKELINQVVDKTYTITDYKGLVGYLKSCGVDPKKFATFISVDKKVNNKKIDELGQLGEIIGEDLEGCYTKEKISEYVKFYEVDGNGEEKNEV